MTRKVISDGAVVQRDGEILEVARFDDIKHKHIADEILGGPDYVVLPGLVNAHSHGKGVTSVQLGRYDHALEPWIVDGWRLPSLDWYLQTLYSTTLMIQTGTTTVMHNHPLGAADQVKEEAHKALQAYQTAGMRVAFSIYYREQNRVVYSADNDFVRSLPPDLGKWLKEFLDRATLSPEEYFRLFREMQTEWSDKLGDMTRVLVSPANLQWCSDEFLTRSKEAARAAATGIHMHILESLYQREFAYRCYGKSAIQHLQQLNFLGPDVSLAHAVWLSEEDMEIIASTNTAICHNPTSNLRLRSGVSPLNRINQKGIRVAIGTDDMGLNDDQDLFQEMRLCCKLHRVPGIGKSAPDAYQVLQSATSIGAETTMFGDLIGTIEKGKRADILLMKWHHIDDPFLSPDTDPVEALIQRARGRDVDTVMIDGVVVYQNGRFTRINQDALKAEIREALTRTPTAADRQSRKMVHSLLPHVEQFYKGWYSANLEPHYRYNSMV